MHREEDNLKSGLMLYNLTPEKLQRTPRDAGSSRRDARTHSQEMKRRLQHTPRNSPDKFEKTPQSSGSFRKDVKSLPDSSKRKIQSTPHESLEKIQKTSGGKFIDTLIGQWSKYMGVQTPISQAAGAQESPMMEEIRRMYATEERKIQLLQKKLQAAEETISSLSAAREAESRAKEEILTQLNTDWESITKYYYEISESLKEFQRHKDNLSSLYNNVIAKQQSTVKKLQQELNDMKLKDEGQTNIAAIAERKAADQEKRIQEIMTVEAELRKQWEDAKTTAILEKNRLDEIHEEEKSELIKKQKNLTSVNEELQSQLKKIEEEKQSLTNIFEGKDKEITKLQEEILMYKDKMENLLCQNAELGEKYGKLIEKERELTIQLELKDQEVSRLQENLNARQEIESSLAKDLGVIENKYKDVQKDFANVENKLKEMQTRNSVLETSLQNTKNSSEQSTVELHKRIVTLEQEKERILSEKQAKIRELENSHKHLEEKYKLEIVNLKKDFDTKLSEMKKTIETQNSAFVKLNETMNKMNEENQKKLAKYRDMKENQGNLKETAQTNVDLNLTEVNTTYNVETQSKANQMYETKYSQSEKRISTPKVTSKSKKETPNQEQQDVYSFNSAEVDELPLLLSQTKSQKRVRFGMYSPSKGSDYTENYSYLAEDKDTTKSNAGLLERQDQKKEDSNAPPKKKIFKTREAGLRQYGTPRKTYRNFVGRRPSGCSNSNGVAADRLC